MNKQPSLKFWATALVTIIIAGLLASSVFNVVATEAKDGIRALLVSTLLLSVVVLGCTLLNQAVKTKNRDSILALTGVLSGYMIILLAFVYFDYGLGGSLNLEQFDSRLRFIIVNLIWIPATLSALVFFYLYRKARELFGKNIPAHVTILEYMVGGLAILGSGWGTFDGVILLSNGDWGLALTTAVGVDFMLALMGFWHIAANDEVTSNVTLIGKGLYAFLALAAQFLDGAMRTAGTSGNPDLSRIGWSVVPFVGIGSAVFVLALYLVDKYYGGVSIGGSRPAQPTAFNRPAQSFTPRPEPIVTSLSAEQREELLSLGYDNPAIDAMKPQEALGRLRGKVRAKQPVADSNHRDPQDF